MARFRTITDTDLIQTRLLHKARLTETGCWLWVGTRRRGYGLFNLYKRTVGAHRASYEAFKGPIPKGQVVRHGCDNPSCINPDHLSLGTQKDNARDRMERGRGHKLKGEQVATAKLTERDVREIRASVNLSLREIAEKYEIDKSNAWSIRAGKSWKHVGADGAKGEEMTDAG